MVRSAFFGILDMIFLGVPRSIFASFNHIIHCAQIAWPGIIFILLILSTERVVIIIPGSGISWVVRHDHAYTTLLTNKCSSSRGPISLLRGSSRGLRSCWSASSRPTNVGFFDFRGGNIRDLLRFNWATIVDVFRVNAIVVTAATLLFTLAVSRDILIFRWRITVPSPALFLLLWLLGLSFGSLLIRLLFLFDLLIFFCATFRGLLFFSGHNFFCYILFFFLIFIHFGGVSRASTACLWLLGFLWLSWLSLWSLGYSALLGDHLAVIRSNFLRSFTSLISSFLLTLVRIVLSVLFFCHLLNSALFRHLFCLSAILLSFLGLSFCLRGIPGSWSFFGRSLCCRLGALSSGSHIFLSNCESFCFLRLTF